MCFALGSYLTRERGSRVPRRRLEKLFWPAVRADDASHSLSELIRKLRQKGVHIRRDDAACVWLPRDAAAIDIDLLASEEPAALAERDLSILPGYAPRSSPAFNDWVDEWRDDMHARVVEIVTGATAKASAAGDWLIALTLADKILKLDPANHAALVARARAAEKLAQRGRDTGRQSEHDGVGGSAVARLRENLAIPSWSSGRPRGPGAEDTALVGRDETMERLRAQARKAFGGNVSACYISASPGVGKSRVIRELASWARRSGAVTCIVSCGNRDAERPLSAFVRAVPRLRALPGAAGCAPSTLSCLDRITHTASEDAPSNIRDESLYESASIQTSIVDLIEAIAEEQPLLLVVEDIHWIDSASWALIRTIATTARGAAMLVCTSRVRWAQSAWGDSSPFSIEHLGRLDPDIARAHMCNRLQKLGRSTDEQFIHWCVDTSGGNPYFIEELVTYWVTTGEQYSAPPSLIALIETRISSLSPDALRVLQAAAILSKNSSVDLLQHMLEQPLHVLLSSLEELADAGMLTASTGETETGQAPATCRHDFVIKAATHGLSPQGRALLHCAAARVLERAAGQSHAADLLWDCADHWRAAGHIENATRAAVACARHLHDMGLVDDAVRRCEVILPACQTDISRATVLRAMAHSQYVARNWRSFCATVNKVRELERTSNSAESIHDDLELCELNAQRSLHRDWHTTLDITLRCVHSLAADPSHRVQAAINALKIATNIGDVTTIDAVYQEALVLSSDVAVDSRDRLMLTMIYESVRGNTHVAATTARELLLLAERTMAPRHRLIIILNCASALRRGGDAGESEGVCESLFNLAVSFQSFDLAAEACNRLIEMHADAGRMSVASDWVAHYLRLRRPKSELASHRSLRIAIARVHLWRSEWEDASNLLENGTTLPLWKDAVAQFRSAALATKIRLEIGRAGATEAIATSVAELSHLNRRLRTMGGQDYECYSLYLGLRYLGRTDEAGRFLDTYVKRDRRDLKLIAPEILVELARLDLSL